jgi:radical SAM protein with 4Fe4S-binding SPASM domain
MCQIPWEEKGRQMSTLTFNKAVDELFDTLVELHPSNLGEPMMSPWFNALCNKMREKGVLLDITTNGTLLTSKSLASILPIARDVKISFDGATKETFERIRINGRFENVCNNTRTLANQMKKRGVNGSILSLQMTLMRSNYHELPDLVDLAHELGADRVKAYHMFSFSEEMNEESLMPILEDYTPVLMEALERGKELGIQMECAEPVANETHPLPEWNVCHLPWHESWIDIDGSVFACHSHGGESFGNIHLQPFNEIWNSNKYQMIRKGFFDRSPVWNCDGCGMTCKKSTEHQPVPVDRQSFLYSTEPKPIDNVRWSGRMKQFDLGGAS